MPRDGPSRGPQRRVRWHLCAEEEAQRGWSLCPEPHSPARRATLLKAACSQLHSLPGCPLPCVSTARVTLPVRVSCVCSFPAVAVRGLHLLHLLFIPSTAWSRGQARAHGPMNRLPPGAGAQGASHPSQNHSLFSSPIARGAGGEVDDKKMGK